MSDKIRLALMDDHPLFREGVKAMLNPCRDIEIVGMFGCTCDALQIVNRLRPDILMLDIDLPNDMLGAVWQLCRSQEQTRIIILTGSEDERVVCFAMKAGASGYITKSVTRPELTRAIRDVYRGAKHVCPVLAGRILADAGRPAAETDAEKCASHVDLTQRERQVVSQVERGLSNKEIARGLSLSDKTVKHHMTRIMLKLGVRNRMEVVLMSIGKTRTLPKAATNGAVTRKPLPAATKGKQANQTRRLIAALDDAAKRVRD